MGWGEGARGGSQASQSTPTHKHTSAPLHSMVLEEWDFGKVWSCIGCPLQVAAQPIGYAAGYWPGVRASILVPENLRTTPLDTERRRWFLETRPRTLANQDDRFMWIGLLLSNSTTSPAL